MIKLLPITALNYDLPTDPNELDVYINIDDETAKKLASQTHAAKDAPDFNRGRNWRTTWGK